ncbi:DUF2062 domain-containing protein [Anderseniella sp. Alg231-50]|uniref:DUF2062 domain-containing protein n=1 Tax=Anderseniella sp. Alg231-50 TaxID=1922226 RepID=UPI000D560F8C
MILKRRKSIGWIKKVRNFFWPEIGFQRTAKYISYKVNRISGSPHAIALGFAAGAFASFTPLIGFHFVVAALIAWAVGGNLLASAIGTSVGNPLTFPFIWFITHNTGSYLLGQEGREEIAISGPEAGMKLMFTDPARFFSELWGGLEPVFFPMCVGAIPLGLSSGIAAYVVLKPAVGKYKERRRKQREKRMTELRKRRDAQAASQHGAGT